MREGGRESGDEWTHKAGGGGKLKLVECHDERASESITTIAATCKAGTHMDTHTTARRGSGWWGCPAHQKMVAVLEEEEGQATTQVRVDHRSPGTCTCPVTITCPYKASLVSWYFHFELKLGYLQSYLCV